MTPVRPWCPFFVGPPRRPCAQRRQAASRPSTARSSVAAPLRPRPSSAGRRPRAPTQVRPVRSRRVRRRSAICQRRRRPATVPPRRRHAKKDHDVLIVAACPLSNHPARRRPYPPLPSSPGSSAIGQLRRHAATVRPRHVSFVVAGKRDIGEMTMLYLF